MSPSFFLCISVTGVFRKHVKGGIRVAGPVEQGDEAAAYYCSGSIRQSRGKTIQSQNG